MLAHAADTVSEIPAEATRAGGRYRAQAALVSDPTLSVSRPRGLAKQTCCRGNLSRGHPLKDKVAIVMSRRGEKET